MKSGKIKNTLIILAFVIIVLVLFYSFFGPGIILNLTQRTASSSLDTDVRIEAMSVSMLRGRLRLSGIQVANLENFDADDILTVDSVSVSFIPSSVLKDTFIIRDVDVRGVNIYIQQKNGRNNLREFQSRLADEEAVEEEDVEDKKHFLVEIIKIEDIVLNLDILGRKSSAEMDPVILEDIGSREEISAGLLFIRVFGAVTAGAARQLVDFIPTDIPEEAGERLRGIMEGVRDFLPGRESE